MTGDYWHHVSSGATRLPPQLQQKLVTRHASTIAKAGKNFPGEKIVEFVEAHYDVKLLVRAIFPGIVNSASAMANYPTSRSILSASTVDGYVVSVALTRLNCQNGAWMLINEFTIHNPKAEEIYHAFRVDMDCKKEHRLRLTYTSIDASELYPEVTIDNIYYYLGTLMYCIQRLQEEDYTLHRFM